MHVEVINSDRLRAFVALKFCHLEVHTTTISTYKKLDVISMKNIETQSMIKIITKAAYPLW